jgi:vitamin B12 transporter
LRLFRGYKGKYFSLAAILACSAGVSLEANNVSLETKKYEVAQNFASEKEAETKEEALGTIHVIADIEKKKSYEQSSLRTLKQKSHTTDTTEIITGEEIEIKGFQNIVEALNSVAGISSTANGGYGQSNSLYLRGFDSKHTLVLIDGIRVNDASGLSGAQIELIDLYDIDRIEIVKGAQSGVWGSDASGGVVNIITKTKKQGFSGDILTEFGSNDWQKFAGSFGYANKVFDISLSLLSLQTDGISAAAPKKSDVGYGDKDLNWEKDGFENTIVHVKGGVNLSDDDRLEFFIKKGKSENHFDGGAGVDAKDYDNLYGYGEYFNTIRTSLYSVGYIGAHEKHKIDAKVNYGDFKRSFYGGYVGRTYEAYASDELSYIGDGSLLFGLGYLKDEVKLSAGAKFPNDSQDDKYIFATNSNKLGDFITSQSLRFDARDTFEDKLTFKVGAKYNFYKDLFIYASYKTGFLAPNLYQQNYDASNSLEAESSSGYELSVGTQNFLLTYFDQQIKNAINYGGWYPNDFYYNIEGKSRFKGIEVSANYQLSDILGELSYTYLDAKDANGNKIARRPRDKVEASLSWFLSDTLFMNIKGSYVGSRHDTNEVQTGKYFLADYTVNYDVGKRINLYFKIHNVFDKYYQEVDGYGTLGRSFYVGTRGSF